LEKRIKSAIEDFRLFSDRGYRRDSILRFVGDRYQLTGKERLLLHRCVYGKKEAAARRRKQADVKAVKGRRLAVDGYNNLITLESFLQGKLLVYCDDGFIRDLSEVHRRYRINPATEKALNLMAETLKSLRIGAVKVFYDSQLSRSGELAALTRRVLAAWGLEGDATAVRRGDTSVLAWSRLAASSDSVIIQKAWKVLDLAGFIVRKKAPDKVVRLNRLSEEALENLLA
jgi:hypothetical protein